MAVIQGGALKSHIDRTLFDGVARQSYERLLLGQPQFEFGGLWFKDDVYYIVCANGGATVEAWFLAHAIMGPPLEIVPEVPAGGDRVSSRTPEDLAVLRQSSRTFSELELALNLSLQQDFPNFHLRQTTYGYAVSFERELSDQDWSEFRCACDEVGVGRIDEKTVDPTANYRPEAWLHVYGPKIGDAGTDLYLTPSRRLSSKVPKRLRSIVEEDEEFWRDHRKGLFTTITNDQPTAVLPTSWHTPESRCIVDPRAWPANNLRNYLSIFKRVVLVLPTLDQMEQKLNELRVNERELVELVKLGRVSLLLPESINRYSYTLLEPLVESAPDRLLPSRRLAAATILDSRRRVPLLCPGLTFEERYEALHEMSKAVNAPGASNLWKALFTAFKVSWEDGELGIQHAGAGMTSMLGVGSLCSAFLIESSGEDRWFEMIAAAAGVEWAGALGATVAPSPSAEPYTDIVASFYSRVNADGVPTIRPEVHKIIPRILALNDDTPIVPFATAFEGAEIERLRACVAELARWNADPDQLDSAIAQFNASVRALERKRHKLTAFDIVSVAPTVASLAGVAGSWANWITLGFWVLKYLMPFVGNNLAARSSLLSRVFDRTNGLLTGSHPDAVLVARLRKEAKS